MPYKIEIQHLPWPFRPCPGGLVERYDRRSGHWVPCPGTPDAVGYPMVSWKPQGGPRRFLRLHQVVWVTYKGPVPDGFEIDHIDGLLFVDRLSPLRRDLLKRKLRKRAREGWEEDE